MICGRIFNSISLNHYLLKNPYNNCYIRKNQKINSDSWTLRVQSQPPSNLFVLSSLSVVGSISKTRARFHHTLIKNKQRIAYGETLSNATLVKCRKCGNPLGYITVLGKALTPLLQPLQNLKIIGICMECFQKKQ